jgi:Invasion associated locus B (IalB) protein
MLIDRRWRRVLLLLAVAAYAVPALAQQPAPNGAAPAAGAAVKKPPKPKPAPATTGTADAVVAAAGGAKPTLLGQYGDWGAYTASPGGKKICFAIAKPASSETTPAGKTRNPSYMFISSRPGEKVTDEVSIIIGYPFKPNSEATVAVGTASFALYTQQDGAWIKNAAEEAHLIEAMRSGQNAVIKGMSAKGTHSTDVFSLKGLAQALDRTDQDCK